MTGEIHPVNYRKRAEAALASLAVDESISKESREQIKLFTRDCYSEGLTHARVAKYVSLLLQIARRLQKPFDQVTEDDLRELLKNIELAYYTAWTKRDYKIAVKKFWKWLSGGREYPAMVSWIRTSLEKHKVKHPSELLTEDDVKQLIRAAEHPRDRALVAVAWETGCRAGELLTLRIRSYVDQGDFGSIDVNGKSGPRRVPIVAAIPYITNWLSYHPRLGDPASPMWLRLGPGSENHLTYSGYSRLLSRLRSRTGVRKRLHPHLFRHSRATFLAKHLTEAQMKHFFGWVQGSEMASTYVHLSARDIQGSILQMYQQRPSPRQSEVTLKSVPCPRCHNECGSEGAFCARCGSALKQATAVAISEKLAAYDELLKKLLSDSSIQLAVRNMMASSGTERQKIERIVRVLSAP